MYFHAPLLVDWLRRKSHRLQPWSSSVGILLVNGIFDAKGTRLLARAPCSNNTKRYFQR